MDSIEKNKMDWNSVRTHIGVMPKEAILFGVAEDDGKPVLFSMSDTETGAVLVGGGNGIDLLKTIARDALGAHSRNEIQVVVLTNSPDQWRWADEAMVFPIWERGAEDVVMSLVSWAHEKRQSQYVLLVVDSLEKVLDMDFDAITNLRWLLLRGAKRRVRVFAASQDAQWDGFGTSIVPSEGDFMIHDGDDWVKFWTPTI